MDFDPYQEWLQIPAARRPPSYYDLLGLPEDEADRQQFEDAASHRIEQVRNRVLGANRDQALRIVGELSRALDCLTKPEKREAYDRQKIRQSLERCLADDRPPRDIYEVLDCHRFTPDRAFLMAVIGTAREELTALEAGRAGFAGDRAAEKQRERIRNQLAAGEAALSGRHWFVQYHRPLLAYLRYEYAKRHGAKRSRWSNGELRDWLRGCERIHPDRVEAIAAAVAVPEGKAAEAMLAGLLPPAPAEETSDTSSLDEVALGARAGGSAVGKAVPPELPPLPGAMPDFQPLDPEPQSGWGRTMAAAAVLVVVLLLLWVAGALVAYNKKGEVPREAAEVPEDVAPRTGASDAASLPPEGPKPLEDAPAVAPSPAPASMQQPAAGPNASPKVATAFAKAIGAAAGFPTEGIGLPQAATGPSREGASYANSGELTQLVVYRGEVHLLLTRLMRPEAGQPVEAFTNDADFIYELTDYRSAHEDGVADTVSIQGTECGPAESSLRLSRSARLVRLQEIQRAGEPDSRAVVGKQLRTVQRTVPPLNELAQLLRFRPDPGSEIRFTCYVDSRSDSPPALTVFAHQQRALIGLTAASQKRLGTPVRVELPTEARVVASYSPGSQVRVEGQVVQSGLERLTVRAVSVTPVAASGDVTGNTPAPKGLRKGTTPGGAPAAEKPSGAAKLFYQIISPSAVSCFTWTSDGSYLAAGTADRQVIVWDAGTGTALGAPARGHASTITAIAADGNQGLVATGDDGGTILIWNPAANDRRRVCVKNVSVGRAIRSLSWRSNGSRMAAGLTNGEVVSFDPKVSVRSGSARGGNVQLTRGRCSDTSINALAWNPVRANYLAIGDARGMLWLADTNTGRPVCGRAENATQARFFLANANPQIPVGSPLSLSINIVERPCSGCRQLAWSPKGDRFVAVEAELEMWEFTPPGGLKLSDVSFDASEAGATRRPVLPGRAGSSRRQAIPGRAAGEEAAPSESSPFDNNPFAPDFGRGSLPVRPLSTSGRVTSVAWDPEGERLAALLSSRNRVAVWNASTGALLQWWDGPAGSTSLLWSPDGTQLAVGCPAGIEVWAVGPAAEASKNSSGE